jgi:hypothetical protein
VVGDHLVGGVGGVVRVPEHELAAVKAGPRVGQAQPADLRVHAAARRVRRRESCKCYREKQLVSMRGRVSWMMLPTVFLRVVDELHDDGVGVGEGHLRAGQLGVQPVEQLLGGGVELQGVLVHLAQALTVRRPDALRRDAPERGQPVERDLPCAEPVKPLQRVNHRQSRREKNTA